MNRRLATTLVGGATLLAVAGGPALAASAAPAAPAATSGHCTDYPANNNCTYTISVTIVTPGGTISFTISGVFPPGMFTTWYGHSTPVKLGSGTADANGTVSGTVTIPKDFPAGSHTLEIVGANGQTASIPFTVSATPGSTTGAAGSSGSLPFTGADIAAMSAVGAALIIGGGVAFTTGRRRKRASGPVA